MIVTHEVKVHEEPFAHLWSGAKNSEVRRDDRSYQEGNIIILHECRQLDSEPTGRVLARYVTHVQRGCDLPEGVVVLSYGLPSVERAAEVVQERSNGSVEGYSSGKGGRMWLDGEFCLDELEAACVLIRAKCHEDGALPQGLQEAMVRNANFEQEDQNSAPHEGLFP